MGALAPIRDAGKSLRPTTRVSWRLRSVWEGAGVCAWPCASWQWPAPRSPAVRGPRTQWVWLSVRALSYPAPTRASTGRASDAATVGLRHSLILLVHRPPLKRRSRLYAQFLPNCRGQRLPGVGSRCTAAGRASADAAGRGSRLTTAPRSSVEGVRREPRCQADPTRRASVAWRSSVEERLLQRDAAEAKLNAGRVPSGGAWRMSIRTWTVWPRQPGAPRG